MTIDPIIAVVDVEKTSKWYQTIFNCKSIHGGSEFDILSTKDGKILLCLHKWGEHAHPTMTTEAITAGHGLILYFRTTQIDQIRLTLRKMNYKVEREIERNPNSHKREFSVIDPNGYYLTISEYHEYQG